ncbi:MAG: hypothetical protein O7J95_21965, partial [Planctomycetota bacterium]|nr:hypothetical protein [Planctomycetota bacterium]
MSPPKTSLDSKYQIETSHHRCLSCEAELPRGEPHYSVVIATGESLARKDFCLPCWESLPRQKGPPRIELPAGGERPATALEFYAFWKTRRPQGPSGGRLRFDSEVVLDFFRHLADDQPVEETAADGEPAPSAPAETQAEALAPAGATASPAGTPTTAPAGATASPAGATASPAGATASPAGA